MYRAYNYTKIKKREKRVYAVSDLSLGKTGISLIFIKTYLIVQSVFALIAYVYIQISGSGLWNPFNDIEKSTYFYLIFVGLPLGITLLLLSIKIQEYSLFEYVAMYFAPKKVYDQNGKIVSFNNYKITTLFLNIFKEV